MVSTQIKKNEQREAMESDHITLLLALQQEMKILNRRAGLSPLTGEQGDEKEASQGVQGPTGGGGGRA